MLFLWVLAALLLQFAFAQRNTEPTITVLSTTLITITSCHPTATDCPGHNQTLPSSPITNHAPAPPSSHRSSSLGASSCSRLKCNADNCLRAFERGQGQRFCSTFTLSVVTETAGLPSYTTMCTGSTISRVSSACSCLNKACFETSTAPAQPVAHGCHPDSCFQAFVRGKAQAFCSSFTKSPATCTNGLPSYATQCTGSTLARVSSACSCLNSNVFTSQQAFSTPGSVSTFTSQQSFSTPTNVKTHSSQPAFSTPISVNTFTSQPAFSSPTGRRTATASVPVASSAGLSSHSMASSAPAQVFSFTTVFTNSQG
jgi:hypothetical protein